MQYKVKITGNSAPYRWKVFKRATPTDSWTVAQIKDVVLQEGKEGGTSMIEKVVSCEGQAPTYEEARDAARRSAQDCEAQRTYENTVHEEILDVGIEVPDSLPEDWTT